jgi:hypothetical protein
MEGGKLKPVAQMPITAQLIANRRRWRIFRGHVKKKGRDIVSHPTTKDDKWLMNSRHSLAPLMGGIKGEPSQSY